MAARAEGQMRMLSNGTEHSKRDGQRQREGRRRTVVLGCVQRLSDGAAVTAAPAEVLISSLSPTSR